jgi:16S rRNA processing protein RimM
MTNHDSSRICVGIILGAHGLKGDVRLKSLTENPYDIKAFESLELENPEQRIKIHMLKEKDKEVMIAQLINVHDRTTAEQLKGAKLYIHRDQLPLTSEEQYYWTDIVGLKVINLQHKQIGTVHAVYNFGAGDILEIKRSQHKELLLPFTKVAVPEVNLADGYIRVDEEIWHAFDHQGNS